MLVADEAPALRPPTALASSTGSIADPRRLSAQWFAHAGRDRTAGLGLPNGHRTHRPPAPLLVVVARYARAEWRQAAQTERQTANGKPDPVSLWGYKRAAGLDTILGGVIRRSRLSQAHISIRPSR